MPRVKLEVTTAVETITTVELSAKAKRMILERIGEFDTLATEIETKEDRQAAIKTELDTLFAKEGVGAALIDGAAIDGHKLKWVIGSQTKLDEKKLCELTGITPAQITACKTTKEKKPYLKVSVKGKADKKKDGDE